MTFDTLSLAVGDQRVTFPLTGMPMMKAADDEETETEPASTAESGDATEENDGEPMKAMPRNVIRPLARRSSRWALTTIGVSAGMASSSTGKTPRPTANSSTQNRLHVG